MARIITFGELMVRLQPFHYERFVQANTLEFSFGGAEANVAVSLANYGLDAAFVTKLPAHAIGQAAVNSLRRYGVDTAEIVRGGDRVGIYYNEKGASQRGSVCIYDRANSAIQLAKPEEFDWDRIFEGADWFHFTGITPALGPNVAEIELHGDGAFHEEIELIVVVAVTADALKVQVAVIVDLIVLREHVLPGIELHAALSCHTNRAPFLPSHLHYSNIYNVCNN